MPTFYRVVVRVGTLRGRRDGNVCMATPFVVRVFILASRSLETRLTSRNGLSECIDKFAGIRCVLLRAIVRRPNRATVRHV